MTPAAKPATESTNGRGVIRIGRKGISRFAMGDSDDAPVIEVDVIKIHDLWYALDQTFRDDKGEIPAEKWDEYNAAAWRFVRDLWKDSGHDLTAQGMPRLTMTEVMEFFKLMAEEAEKLRRFFSRNTGIEPTSPGSTELTFGT